MIIEFVFGGIFKERKWRWAIIWNEFSHGIKYQTFICKKEYVSACDILVGIHSSDAEPGFTKYSNFHLKFDTSIPLGYIPVCICTGFPSYLGCISLSSTFSSLVNYGSTKAVVYSDQHVTRI
jgi:hypothetical protein